MIFKSHTGREDRTIKRHQRNTFLFISFLLLAGIANLLSKAALPEWDTLMTCINYLILTGLLVFWIEAVRFRLLPSAARTATLSAAFFMLLYMFLRIFKYRFAVSITAQRYAVYAYWIPQMLIPGLFLITCIHISRSRRERKTWHEILLLIPALALSVMVMTNDLHAWVYIPGIELSRFIVDTGTYRYGFGFYLMYVWMIAAAVPGFIFLFRESGSISRGVVKLLAGTISLWFGLILLNLLVLDRFFNNFHLFNNPEIHIFGMLGVYEICIQYRLIPYNENYTGLFERMQIPVLITDRDFHIIYRSEKETGTAEKDLRESLTRSVDLPENRKLNGKKIRAGYAFWSEDVSAIRQMQDELERAIEITEKENDLIQAETEQKKKDAFLQSRHRIYHEIAAELYPCQKKIREILQHTVPGTESFRKNIEVISVHNAYVKRKTNLLLLASEKNTLSTKELFLALQESAAYLTLAGLQATTSQFQEEQMLPAEILLELYDAFETITEQLLGHTRSLMISWHHDSLRLAAETDFLPGTQEIPLPIRFLKDEGITYIDIQAVKGGEAS